MDVQKPTTITTPTGIELTKSKDAQGSIINDGANDRILTGFQKSGFGTKDFGIKVSQQGYDVKTATDDQLVMSSAFNMFKIVTAPGTFSIAGMSLSSGATNTTTLAHNLGYTPAILIYVNAAAVGGMQGGNGLTGLPLTYVVVPTAPAFTIQYRVDSTNLYIDFINHVAGTTNLTGSTWSFKYYLLRETAQ